MSLVTENPIAIEALFSARNDAEPIHPGEVTWFSTGDKLQVRVGDEEMPVIVTDDINFSVPFVARIGDQAFFVSPTLM
jgi:hypothetical protein